MTKERIRSSVDEIKQLIQQGKAEEAFGALKVRCCSQDDFVVQHRFCKLLDACHPVDFDLYPIRIALLGSSTLDHFAQVLRLWLALEGFAAEFFLAEFDTVCQTILDRSGGLYRFNPDLVWIFSTYSDINMGVQPGATHEVAKIAVETAVRHYRHLWDTILKETSAMVIQNNFDLPAERVFGNYEGSTAWGMATLLRRLNVELASATPAGVTIFDMDYVASLYGKWRWSDPRLWFHSKHAFSLDACGLVAFHGARLIGAIKGKGKKCVIMDLDNTLWGGTIGDDGLDGIRLGYGAEGEAFMAFQAYLGSLKDRGIILAVCSKNEEDIAKEPFLKHPDMRLRLEDIAVFRANWINKADNIRDIASILNIGMDSMVFLDDNPVERELVRTELPMVTVPELPDDPAQYVSALDRHRLFETISFSDEDSSRSLLYKNNASRQEFRQNFTDLSSYLKSLGMEATVGSCDKRYTKRMAQLINKSNQFHLTGTRYTESQLEAISSDPNREVLYFRLSDRFGDNGLISVVVLDRVDNYFSIDTWVMSCRVLSRGMEEFICREILYAARNQGRCRVLGHYVPSTKNRLVSRLYERLGFVQTAAEVNGTTHWEIALSDHDPEYEIHIRRINAEAREGQD